MHHSDFIMGHAESRQDCRHPSYVTTCKFTPINVRVLFVCSVCGYRNTSDTPRTRNCAPRVGDLIETLEGEQATIKEVYETTVEVEVVHTHQRRTIPMETVYRPTYRVSMSVN